MSLSTTYFGFRVTLYSPRVSYRLRMCSCLSSNPKSNQVVRFSPNNERLAVGSRDNFIDVYDARTYASARTLVRCGHTG